MNNFKILITTLALFVCCGLSTLHAQCDDAQAPIVSGPLEICQGNSGGTLLELTASCDPCVLPSGATVDPTVIWYDVATGSGTVISGSGATFTVPVDPTIPGVYTFEAVCSCNGCESPAASTTVTVNAIAELDLDTVTNETCPGESDGTVSVDSHNGGDQSYGIFDADSDAPIATSPSTTGPFVFTGLAPGDYYVTYVDAGGAQIMMECNDIAFFTVQTAAAVMVDSAVATDVSCNGSSDGAITLMAAGDAGFVAEFSLNGGAWQTSGSFTGLAAGSYTITVRNQNAIDCTFDLAAIVVAEPDAIAAGTGVDVTICSGQATAALTADIEPCSGCEDPCGACAADAPIVSETFTETIVLEYTGNDAIIPDLEAYEYIVPATISCATNVTGISLSLDAVTGTGTDFVFGTDQSDAVWITDTAQEAIDLGDLMDFDPPLNFAVGPVSSFGPDQVPFQPGDSFDILIGSTADDAGTATFTITYTFDAPDVSGFPAEVAPVVTWWNSPVFGSDITTFDNDGVAEVFDPIAAGLVNPSVPGDYTFYVQSDCDGCFSERTPVTLSVLDELAAPSIEGPSSLCPGETGTYTVADDGVDYTFTLDGETIGTGNSVTITFDGTTASQTIAIAGVDANGCTNTSSLVVAQEVNSAMFCSPTKNASVGTDCAFEVTPFTMVKSPLYDESSYAVTLITNSETGAIVYDAASGTGSTSLVLEVDPAAGGDCSQIYSVTVEHLCSGNRCSGTLTLEDKTAPTLTCPADVADFPVSAVSNSLSADSPTFNRTFGGVSACTLSGTGSNVAYDAYTFSVSEDGTYTFAADYVGTDPAVDGGDGYGYIYEGSFDPADPCNNLIATDDDSNGNLDPLLMTVALEAGVTYILVTSDYDNDEYGSFDWTFTTIGTGSILAPSDLQLFCTQYDDIFTPAVTTLDLAGDALITGMPTVDDNCANFFVTYSDVDNGTNCDLSILRTFTVTDACGNVASCDQLITFGNPDLNLVMIPHQVNLECDGSGLAQAHPDALSDEFNFPYIGDPITGDLNEGLCNINITWTDEVLEQCGSSYKILREWTILDWCAVEAGAELTNIQRPQIIFVTDTTGPEIVCPAQQIYAANPFACESEIIIPGITFTDNCSNDLSGTLDDVVSVTVDGVDHTSDAIDGDEVLVIGAGDHEIVYTAVDDCENVSTCTTVITIEDQTAPNPICDENTVATLGGDGTVSICWDTFDDGSFDNCDDVIIRVKRMDADELTTFSECVDFDCADLQYDDACPANVIGVTQVRMRVYQAGDAGNLSFGDVENGGILYNECMINVEVQDKQAPAIICPPDKFLACMDDYNAVDNVSDNEGDGPEVYLNDVLIGYYTGPIIDNCDNHRVDLSEAGSVDGCGEGDLYRTYTITDMTTCASHSCVQRINVSKTPDQYFLDGVAPSCDLYENNITSPLTVNGVQGDRDRLNWPADRNINCASGGGAESTEPTAPSHFPSYVDTDEDDCTNLLQGYEDKFHYDDPNNCYRILRTWTVYDWCQYDPNSGSCQGVWSHVQVINVNDSQAPVITCGDDITVAANSAGCASGDGCTGTVDLPIEAVDGCGGEVTFSYEVDADWNGVSFTADISGEGLASGDYPSGLHRVRYTATDACGNTSSCMYNFRIMDMKAPTPICVALNSVTMDESGSLEIWASDFESGSSCDNCTLYDNLQWRIRKANDPTPLADPLTPNDLPTGVTFTCADGEIGGQEVQIYLFDEAGNYDFCLTGINIIPGDEDCLDATEMLNIAGHIETEDTDMVEDVNVDVSGTNTSIFTTGTNGLFDFMNSAPIGGSYVVTPEKDIDYLNGVTTFDLVLISQHILGVQTLDSPYKIIAADANKSNSVTTLDLVKIQRLILNIDPDLAPNTSWRFVDTDHAFSNPTNPFVSTFPEVISITNMTSDEMDADFVGVKIGDVNGSATPNMVLGNATRNIDGHLTLVADETSAATGETFTVDFTAENFDNVLGYQFTLDFDPRSMDMVEIIPGALKGLTTDNFGLAMLNDGVITTSWHNASSVSVKSSEVLFSIEFKAISDLKLSDVIGISSEITRAEAYNGDADLLDVDLGFDTGNGVVTNAKFELLQNSPNPFRGETLISFSLPTATPATLSIMDVSGKLLKTIEGDFVKGYNEVKLNSAQFEGAGVLYYQLDTPTDTATKKMILID